MANEFLTRLGLIDKDLSGKLVQVVEEHGSSASFVVGSFLWNASQTHTSVCFLTLHYCFSHYHNMLKISGVNLKSLVDNKTVVALDPFNNYFEKGHNGEEDVKMLFSNVKETLDKFSGKKCLIIDDLSGLLSMGYDLKLVVSFLQYCRSLQDTDKDLALVVCSHRSENNEDLKILCDFIAHVADYRMAVAALKTGFSLTVTGSIKIWDNLDRKCSMMVDDKHFHFKLFQRLIEVFAPGTVGIHG